MTRQTRMRPALYHGKSFLILRLPPIAPLNRFMGPSEELQRKLELVVQTGLLLAKHSDLQAIVQAATDAGLELCGAQFGAFFYNVINARGESYLLYTLSGVQREKFSQFPMPRNTAVFEIVRTSLAA